ncbi:MAG TPA: rhodanese-like domain-containing protein [Steroidobacteraceae bacterium]|nr:rhodanese-like domain-containing protein [Steroidobacteraceae bacterium]
MKHDARTALATLCLMLCIYACPGDALAKHLPASSIPAAMLIEPAALAAELKSAGRAKPLVLQVGFHTLYEEAHIAGAEYAGPAAEEAGLRELGLRVKSLPKDADIVIYCGCCPWSHCPNIAAAFDRLRSLGFTHVRVLHLADNFGADWVDKGYPVASAR